MASASSRFVEDDSSEDEESTPVVEKGSVWFASAREEEGRKEVEMSFSNGGGGELRSNNPFRGGAGRGIPMRDEGRKETTWI